MMQYDQETDSQYMSYIFKAEIVAMQSENSE